MATSGWLDKFNKLHEEPGHPVEEEEVFVLARKLISETRAKELGDEFARLKAKQMKG